MIISKATIRVIFLSLFSFVLILIVSCSSENIKIKKALKATIPNEQLRDYKYKSHQILETLLSNNVEDSISSYETANTVKEMSIERKLKLKDSYQENLDDCRRKRQHTLSWLRGDYDSLIRDWQEMLEDVNEQIMEDSLEISSNNKKIAFFKQHLYNTNSPIIFYKILHEYQLNGAYHREEVMLDANYELIK